MTIFERRDARGADVIADDGSLLAKFDRQGQTDVAEADHGKSQFIQSIQ